MFHNLEFLPYYGLRKRYYGTVSNNCELEHFVQINDLHDENGSELECCITIKIRKTIKSLNLKVGDKVSFVARLDIVPDYDFLKDIANGGDPFYPLDGSDSFHIYFVYPTKWKVLEKFPWIDRKGRTNFEIDEDFYLN